MKNTNLLEQLVENAGLSEESAIRALATIAGYARVKYPILEGSINSYLTEELKHADPGLLLRILSEQN